MAEQLTDDAKQALKALDQVFKRRTCPTRLDLAITGGQGLSITALIGLTAKREGVQLPLASWGAGTRRFAALAIAEQNQGEAPITLVDEVERGLEPYRQRVLMNNLLDGTIASLSSRPTALRRFPPRPAQASGISIMPARSANLRRRRSQDTVKPTRKHFLRASPSLPRAQPNSVSSRALLEKAFGSSLQKHGVHVTDGGGHVRTLGLLEALASGGLRFGGFADDEGKHPTRWQSSRRSSTNCSFAGNPDVSSKTSSAIVPEDKLEALLTDPEDEKTGMRLRTLADGLESRRRTLRR